LRAFGDFLGVCLALNGLSVQHFLCLHHDLVGLLGFFVIFECKLNIFQESLDLLVLFHLSGVLGFELGVLCFELLYDFFLLCILLPEGYEVLVHFDRFNCDGFFVLIAVVFKVLLFSQNLLWLDGLIL
jgi:hypothetical protein